VVRYTYVSHVCHTGPGVVMALLVSPSCGGPDDGGTTVYWSSERGRENDQLRLAVDVGCSGGGISAATAGALSGGTDTEKKDAITITREAEPLTRPVGIVVRTRNSEQSSRNHAAGRKRPRTKPARMAITPRMAPLFHSIVSPTSPCLETRDNPKVHIPHQKQGSQLQQGSPHLEITPRNNTPPDQRIDTIE
jgi:hypothetical protein